MGILNIDLNNNNLDNNFKKDYSDTIIHIRILDWHIKLKKEKYLKNGKWRTNGNSVAS